jgi:patatin-related protein
MNATPVAERSREVRLGVVMFGGISLAVYINGVASELFRAVRGRGVYRLLKALTDSHIVVDVLSGASAGGINGVLLSAALCNQTDFESTTTLWREHADIEKLLEPTPGGRPIDNSVLNGDYDQTQLEAAFRELLGPPSQSTEKEDPSPVGELDLFITGTDIHGQFGTRRDALDHRIELEDHRVLFQLKHRADRKVPFSAVAFQNGKPHAPNSDTRTTLSIRALATLSHITSCFPGAFEPLKVKSPTRLELASLPDDYPEKSPKAELSQLVYNRLAYWGQLADKATGAARTVTLMDGGVLQNKPFTSTIQAIFTRLADTQVRRYMLYVEPDPKETADARKADAEAKAETKARLEGKPAHATVNGTDPATRIVSVAYAAASGLPRFESIDADLRLVDTHNEQVQRYESLLKAATEAVMSASQGAPAASPTREAYQRARLADLASKVEAALHARSPAPSSAPRGEDSRLEGLIELLAQLDSRATLKQLYAELDVLFRFRRLVNITYAVDDESMVEAPEPDADGRPYAQRKRRVTFSVPSAPGTVTQTQVERELLTTLNRQIELYEIVRARLEDELAAFARSQPTRLDLGDPECWRRLAERARAVLASLPMPACFEARSPLPALNLCVTKDELEALGKPHPLPPVPPMENTPGRLSFLEAADHFEDRLLRSPSAGKAPNEADTILLKLHRHFEQIDEVALPLELVSALRGRDQVQTVRVSPADATRAFAGRFVSEPPPAKFASKLCGVQLADFGAFFKRSWRSNDLMWGRIDGSAQLLDILLDPKRLAQLTPELLHANLVEALGPKLDLSEIFPHAPSKLRHALEEWLKLLASGDKDAALTKLATPDEALRNLWAHAVQLEILSEQLPGVLEDAADEAEGAKRIALLSQARQLRTVPGEIDRYFWPDSYAIARETLPADMPKKKMRKLIRLAVQHLTAAIAQSIPQSDCLLRGLFAGTANTATWLFSGRWVDSEKASSDDDH